MGGAHEIALVAAAASAMVLLVVLVGWAKVHPFIALILASAALGLGAGLHAEKVLAAFQKGFGETLGGIGVVLVLGTMLGKLLADSGEPTGSSPRHWTEQAPARCRGRWRGPRCSWEFRSSSRWGSCS